MSVIGVMITAVSVGFFKLAAFGVDPFQSFMSGIDQLVSIEFGTLYVIVNVCMLLFALLFDRHYIGIATFINLFFLGYVVQFSYEILQMIFTAPSVLIRIFSFIFGFVALCFGASIYMTADLGVSTYDAIALIMANTWKLWQFKYVRICTDVVCVILGITMFLIGGGEASLITTFVGIGTILTAFFMGPLIDLFNRKFFIPLLNR